MARPAAGCGLELETTHLTLLVHALWVAGGRSTSQRHQRERGGSAGLYSQTEAHVARARSSVFPCGTVSLPGPCLRSALSFRFLQVSEAGPPCHMAIVSLRLRSRRKL